MSPIRMVVLFAAVLTACSPASDAWEPTIIDSPTQPSLSAPDDPSFPIPDPFEFDPRNPVTAGFLPHAIAVVDPASLGHRRKDRVRTAVQRIRRGHPRRHHR
jgi:hypothetical protein